jgi:hypothetical protein
MTKLFAVNECRLVQLKHDSDRHFSLLAGTTVALVHVAMRLSELITIYLAAAAPVGVAYFLRRHGHTRRTMQLLRAAIVALLWPLTLLLYQFTERRNARPTRNADRARRTHKARITAAERALVNTLHQVNDLLSDAYGARSLRARQAATDARASVERFTGLALAVAAEKSDAAPTARELELFRVAGRKGADLLVAGRCVHRRNHARLRAHHEQARNQFVHALAELLETVEHNLPARAAGAEQFAQLYWLIIRVFAQAIDLLSLLDDRATAISVARLLDAACAWARRHEVLDLPRTNAAQIGGALCPPATQPVKLTHPTPQATV